MTQLLQFQKGLGNSSRTASSSSLSSSTSSSGQSWADKVRGAPVSLESSQLSLQGKLQEGNITTYGE